MRSVAWFVLAVLLNGCASHETSRQENWTVTYYDRNHDGMVDYELHTLGPHMADADWALIDTKFIGRYDLRIHWGYVLEKKKVDLAVPKNVKITPGKKPKHHAV